MPAVGIYGRVLRPIFYSRRRLVLGLNIRTFATAVFASNRNCQVLRFDRKRMHRRCRSLMDLHRQETSSENERISAF